LALYGVSEPTLYRQLRHHGQPHAVGRSDRGVPRVLPAATLERYLEVIAAVKRRTANRQGRYVSTPEAIRLLENYGLETPEGLVQAPKGLLKTSTVVVKGVPRSRWLTALGHHDQLVAWLKPKTCPSWLTREALAALPETLELREVRYHIDRPGFRTRQITLVTTRLDAKIYRVADLAELYHQRWRVETSLAQLKTSMQMDVLHGKTVPGVLKE
jgi:IS4 transposase